MRSIRRPVSVLLMALLFPLVALATDCQSASAAPPAPDFAKAAGEATDYLSKYLQIDTTNPPGNEQSGAEYLAKILKDNGIDAEIIPTGESNRACVYARLKGNGKKKGIVLLNHIDVVPAQAADWMYPPFNGEIHEGELWGRGALDMKNMGIAELEAFEASIRIIRPISRFSIDCFSAISSRSGMNSRSIRVLSSYER